MPNLARSTNQPNDRHQRQPSLPQTISLVPPLSTTLSNTVPLDQQTLHHYQNNSPMEPFQDKHHSSLLQQPMPNQKRPSRRQLQKKQQTNCSDPLISEDVPSVGETSLDVDEEQDSESEDKQDKKTGRRKIKIEYIEDKTRRHITFSKRKAGIMKKAHELATLTGTQVLLLVVSETGLVYTFTTPKLQPLITKPEGKNLIQSCLNAPDSIPGTAELSSTSHFTQHHAYSNDPNTEVRSPTTSFYDGRRPPYSQNYIPTPPLNYASQGHFGYSFQGHPSYFPLSTSSACLNAGYPYSPLPHFSQYSGFSNASYVNPATYWPPSNPSSPTGSLNSKVHHHPPPPTSESRQTEFQVELPFPSPPEESLKEWASVTTSAQVNSTDERLQT